MSTVKLHYKNIAADAQTYIGEVGSVFFDPATSQLRVGDGVTPGGNAVTLDIGLATHDDFLYISGVLEVIQGSGFSNQLDNLRQISTRLTTAQSGITATNNTLASNLSVPTSSLATAANLATAQSSLNTITTNVNSMASGTTLTAVQSSLGSSITSATNTLKGIGFVPGTDDLHNIRSAISTLQSDINSIKTHLGI